MHIHVAASWVANIAADVAALAALITVLYARATVRDARLERQSRALQEVAKLVEETRAAAEASRLGIGPDSAWIGAREQLQLALISLRCLPGGVELMAWAGTRGQVEALAEQARSDLRKALIAADLAQLRNWDRLRRRWRDLRVRHYSRKLERDILRRNPLDS